MRFQQQTSFKICASEQGAMLIVIIISMVVLAITGAAIYTMSSTSHLNQSQAQKSVKAYYLSESCLRIAASEYKAAAITEKISTLINLQNRTFDMPDNQGSCTINVYPYWFYASTTKTYPIGATSITLCLPGEIPKVDENGTTPISLALPDDISAKLKKKGSSTDVFTFSSASFGGAFVAGAGWPVTFTLKTSLTSEVIIKAGDEFYLGGDYTLPAIPVTISRGGNLVINIDDKDEDDDDQKSDLTAKMFPPVRGSIFLDISGVPQLSYDKRILNTATSPHTVTLTNIQAIGTTLLPLTISAHPAIYMGRSLGFKSEAKYGD